MVASCFELVWITCPVCEELRYLVPWSGSMRGCVLGPGLRNWCFAKDLFGCQSADSFSCFVASTSPKVGGIRKLMVSLEDCGGRLDIDGCGWANSPPVSHLDDRRWSISFGQALSNWWILSSGLRCQTKGRMVSWNRWKLFWKQTDQYTLRKTLGEKLKKMCFQDLGTDACCCHQRGREEAHCWKWLSGKGHPLEPFKRQKANGKSIVASKSAKSGQTSSKVLFFDPDVVHTT